MLKNLAIVGATGAVGRELLALLEERPLPVERITLLASTRSAGLTLNVRGRAIEVQPVDEYAFDDATVAIFCASADVSREFAPRVVQAGGVVVDNSSAYRMDDHVPLVIPEVNADDIARHRGIIANPNCTTIIMLVAVAPIHRRFPVRRVVLSTYQAASGAGLSAMEELQQQTRDVLEGRKIKPRAFPHPIAFNLFAHDSPVDETGYNGEERKVIAETRKILHEPDLAVSPTCIRVPVFRAHSESINLTFDVTIHPGDVRRLLAEAPGVRIVDDPRDNHFPMPIEAAGGDDVLVGRIRSDLSQPDGRGIEMFVVGDQLRKGAALNALQIAEVLAHTPVG